LLQPLAKVARSWHDASLVFLLFQAQPTVRLKPTAA
jgi:hypothetical protein